MARPIEQGRRRKAFATLPRGERGGAERQGRNQTHAQATGRAWGGFRAQPLPLTRRWGPRPQPLHIELNIFSENYSTFASMSLFIEIAPGVDPVIYKSKCRLYLVPRKYLLACYVFACKAQALQLLTKYPSRFEFGKAAQSALRSLPSIQPVHWVQRQPIRRGLRGWIESHQTAPYDDFSIDYGEEEGD